MDSSRNKRKSGPSNQAPSADERSRITIEDESVVSGPVPSSTTSEHYYDHRDVQLGTIEPRTSALAPYGYGPVDNSQNPHSVNQRLANDPFVQATAAAAPIGLQYPAQASRDSTNSGRYPQEPSRQERDSLRTVDHPCLLYFAVARTSTPIRDRPLIVHAIKSKIDSCEGELTYGMQTPFHSSKGDIVENRDSLLEIVKAAWDVSGSAQQRDDRACDRIESILQSLVLANKASFPVYSSCAFWKAGETGLKYNAAFGFELERRLARLHDQMKKSKKCSSVELAALGLKIGIKIGVTR